MTVSIMTSMIIMFILMKYDISTESSYVRNNLEHHLKMSITFIILNAIMLTILLHLSLIHI